LTFKHIFVINEEGGDAYKDKYRLKHERSY
jgi:hypothetical protein